MRIRIAGLAIVAFGVCAVGAQQESEAPVFTARSELVVLHVTVEDRHRGYVPDLTADAFTVREDNVPQTIEFFNQLDAPATVGLIIDSSGSMSSVRQLVAAAAETFVDTSNSDDEVFSLTFNDDVRAVLPETAPFTSDGRTLRTALVGSLASRGRTAFHDAVLGGLQYLRLGTHARRVLVVVGDGADNASAAAFEDVITRTRMSDVLIYTIAVVDPLDHEARPGRLRQLAQLTGGESYEPKEIGEMPGILRHIAREIRSMYTIGYVPPSSARPTDAHQIRISVRAPNHTSLKVRARQGYLAASRAQ